MAPFSVTRLIPPLGESKLIATPLWNHIIVGGGSGEYLTRHVRLIVEPMLMKRSGPPRISVIGSEIEIDCEWVTCELFVTVTINNFGASVLVVNRNEGVLLGTQFMALHLRNVLERVF